MKRFQIAVLPGDGIGVEVTDEGLKVLRAVEARMTGVGFDIAEYAVGAGAYLNGQNPLPESTLRACREADAVLLGAMGLPDVRWPDGKEIAPQLDLREQLDLYCGVRPIRLYHEADTPLKRYRAGEIDLVIIRESTEGLFSTRLANRQDGPDEVRDVLKVTRSGSERLFRAAFRIAGQRRKRLSLVDKANVLPSMVFFREIFDAVAREFPDVETECLYVDCAALFLVQRPQAFDVLVTENMFGDILSDLAAGLVGGMGMAPSGDIGEDCAVFQPAHGSAPDIAGRGIANPVAMVLSVAMMLDWLGHAETTVAAEYLRAAVEHVLADPVNRTADLGGKLSTDEMGSLIATEVKRAWRA